MAESTLVGRPTGLVQNLQVDCIQRAPKLDTLNFCLQSVFVLFVFADFGSIPLGGTAPSDDALVIPLRSPLAPLLYTAPVRL